MSRGRGRSAALLGVIVSMGAVALPRRAHADGGEPPRRRWGVGLQVAPFGTPAGHIGIPLSRAAGREHAAVEITLRWEASRHLALTGAVGLPHSSMGLGIRAGCELFARVFADRREIVSIELYHDPGLQLGFAGPDYTARHSHVFAGYPYAAEGPLAFALRVPAGLRLRWARGAFDTYVEEVPILAFTPSFEPFFEVGAGVRVRF